MKTTSELAKALVAQGRLSQDAYERLFSWKIEEEKKVEGRSVGTPPVVSVERPPKALAQTGEAGQGSAHPQVKEPGARGAERPPSTPIKTGGQDPAAGPEEDFEDVEVKF